MTALSAVDWQAQLGGDWGSIVEQAANAAGVDPSQALAALPIPDLKAAGQAIETVSGIFDGEISPADIQNVSSTLASAAGLVLGATALAVPGLGPAIAPLVTVIVGGILNGLFGGEARAERDAALKAQLSESRDAARAWEDRIEHAAWEALAHLAALDLPRAQEDALRGAIDRVNAGRSTPEDAVALEPFATRSRDLLKGWGWKPEGTETGYGKFSGSPLSWAAIQAAYQSPLPTRKDQHGNAEYGRTYQAKTRTGTTIETKWTSAAPTTQERVTAAIAKLKDRLDFEGKIAARWQAYTAELGALREGAKHALEKMPAPSRRPRFVIGTPRPLSTGYSPPPAERARLALERRRMSAAWSYPPRPHRPSPAQQLAELARGFRPRVLLSLRFDRPGGLSI